MNTKRMMSAILAAVFAASPLLASARPDDDEQKTRSDRERARAEAKAERESDLYEQGTDALDDKDFARAAKLFRKVAQMQMEHAGAALYWLAHAQNELGQRAEALASLLELQKTYPKSQWAEDGKALEVEIRQSSGQRVEPDQFGDDDVKLMAVNGLLGSDPERALPLLEHILNGKSSPRVKERAIFVLSQSNSPRAVEILGRVARDGSRRDLQDAALRYIGIMGGQNSGKLLADVYASNPDVKVKRGILKSYMISGDRVRLLTLAKSEPNDDLRGEAVRYLGILGSRSELAELYRTENAVPIRKHIIQAMFIGGNADKLAEIARSEKAPELRATAIRDLGLIPSAKSGDLLVTAYDSDSNREVRSAVINALFLQSNAKALINLARKEKDPELKKEIVKKLSLIRSPEVADYLMEVLKD